MSEHETANINIAAPPDWHRADIKAALEKAGWSLRRLSICNGYCPYTAKTALDRPWPRMERIIADAIGVPPATIWPSRYAKRRPSESRSTNKIAPPQKSARRNSTTNQEGDAA